MRPLLLITFCFFALYTYSQQHYTGYSSDNFNGYTGSYTNPASIANSVNKFSLTGSIIGLSSNNFLGDDTNPISQAFNNQQQRYREHISQGYNMNNLSFDIIGAYYEINHENSIGYSLRVRQFGNIDGLSNVLTNAIDNGYDDTKPVGTGIAIDGYNFSQFIYTEHRFNYARVIQDDRSPHFFKGGVALKLINGIDATYLYANDGDYEFLDQFSAATDFSDVEFRYGRAEKENSFSSRSLGFGLDLGAVYEYRPDKKKYLYDMDGETNIERYDQKKYLYKLGASITDIGRVRFAKDPNSFDFRNTGNPVNIDYISTFGASNEGNNSLFKTFDSLAANGIPLDDNDENFNMNLPTLLNLQADYNIWRSFYVNWTSAIPLKRRRDPHKAHFKAIHSITPRYESQKVSVMLPMTFQRNAQFNVGFAVRLDIYDGIGVFFGTNNFSGFFGKRASYTNNAYGGLSYAIPYKIPKDTDGDKVSDPVDECVYDPGPYSLNGCPDTDGDGIVDKEDHCIYDPGPAKHNGCPDRDGDGVIDMNDQCPDLPGLPVHYGCPDSDGDGVIDIVDQCPDEPGIELNNGCPYEMPQCCTEDRDGDGIPDEVDECPETPGSMYNRGCPIDSTNINTIDLQERKEEKDPNNTRNDIEEIKEDQEDVDRNPEEGTMIQDYNSSNSIERLNVYFNFDDATVSERYDKEIRALAAKYDEGYRFVVIGHTDHRGSETYNLILSKKRAEVVSRKLGANSIDNELINVYYYGEWKPLKSNDNKEGRNFNRRVEILVERL